MAEASTIEAPEVAAALSGPVENDDTFRQEFESESAPAQSATPAKEATNELPPADPAVATASGAEDGEDGKPKPEATPTTPVPSESADEKWMRERAETLSKKSSTPAPKDDNPAAPAVSDREKQLESEIETLRREIAESLTRTGTSAPALDDPAQLVDSLPDGDLKNTVKTVVGEYPEVMQAVVALATMIAKKGQAPADGSLNEAVAEVRKQHDALAYEIQKTQFWNTVERGVLDAEGNYVKGHLDAQEIVNTKEFAEWQKQLPPMMKKVVGSWDGLDGIRVISAFKEARARTVKAGKDAVLADKKAKKDGLLGDSLKDESGLRASRSSSTSIGDDKREFEDEFNKA